MKYKKLKIYLIKDFFSYGQLVYSLLLHSMLEMNKLYNLIIILLSKNKLKMYSGNTSSLMDIFSDICQYINLQKSNSVDFIHFH